MNKKIILGILVILFIVGVLGYFLLDNRNHKKTTDESHLNDNTTTNTSEENDENNTTISSNEKILVVYYSASGSTRKVAEQISENLNAELFEITPEDKYTSDDLNWSNENSRVSREHADESLRNVSLTTTKVDHWEDYDIVLIGYPIWWGISAWPVDSFVKANDFTDKTVIPFCTSASSGIGQSGKLLERIAKGGNWREGHRFSSGASNSEIKDWTDSLK